MKCPKLTAMPVLPVLKELRMQGNRMLLGQVKSGPQSLERLILEECEDLAQPLLEDDEQMRAVCGSLRSLTIHRCNYLFSVPQSSQAPLGFWKSLASLEHLTISRCDALGHWPVVEFHGLISLKSLVMEGCYKLTGPSPSPSPSPLPSLSSPPSPGERGILPQLETLQIMGSSLVQLPKCPASLRTLDVCLCPNLKSLVEGLGHVTALERMTIYYCPSLMSLPAQLCHNTGLAFLDLNGLPGLRSLPQGLAQLTALKVLKIFHCAQLSSLPEGLGGLTALRHLEVGDCPRLTSFPDGLQRRLRGLEKLIIRGCPSLERRCKEGGEYWHLVSGIPYKEIVITPSRSSFSTLLPPCHCSGQSSTT